MPFFTALFAIGTFIAHAASAVVGVVNLMRSSVRESAGRLHAAVEQRLEGIDHALRRLNDHIEMLEAKRARDGRLSLSEREEIEHHRKERINAMQRWGQDAARRLETDRTEDTTLAVSIDSEHVHIAEGHVGFNAVNRTCPKCGRLLTLRRNPTKPPGDLAAYFWGCPAIFEKDPLARHKHTESIFLNETALGANMEIIDWQTPTAQLQKLVSSFEGDVDNRLRDHMGEQIERIVCGMHGEPLILRRRSGVRYGLLDAYKLACARAGCQYAVSLSNVGQLTAFLSATEGRGIL